MKVVEMSTELNMRGEKLSVQEFANRNLDEIASYGNEHFVVVGEAYLDNNSSSEAAYFAYAVKLGDKITNCEVPLYLIEFEITNLETYDGNKACNWAQAAGAELVGTVDVIS
jgi:hypothetical protein